MWFVIMLQLEFFYFFYLIMEIINEVNSLIKLLYSWKQFSSRLCFAKYSIEYSWNQQCLRLEMPTTLVYSEKHILNKRSFLEYF
jgi:hypothetical protein